MKGLLLSLATIALVSCTHIDTGQTDYRIADVKAPLSGAQYDRYEATCPAGTPVCRPLAAARLIRKYQPGFEDAAKPFESNQVYSIDILQGVIGSRLLEDRIFGHDFGKTGEFAILANVFEFSPDQAGAARSRFVEFGPTAQDLATNSGVDLVLVYYSGDVRQKQPFSFSNIPLKARTRYTGGSVAVQLVVMEIDAQSGPVKSLLTTLAGLGQDVAPIPGPAKKLLFDLGESIIKGGNSDDRLLDYRFVLSAPTLDAVQRRATFAPGQYVIRRSQQRDTEPAWGDLLLDSNTGRLLKQSGDNFVAVRDELYLVLDVKRFAIGTPAEYYQSPTWTAFRDALQVAVDQRDQPIQTIADNLGGMMAHARAGDWESRLSAKWQEAEQRLKLYSARIPPDQAPAGCTLLPNLDFDRDFAEREARTAVEGFQAAYASALAAGKVAKSPALNEFPPASQEPVVSAVARYFMPWSPSLVGDDFVNAAKFEKSFFGPSPAKSLWQLGAQKAVARRTSSTDCKSLIDQGFAS